MVKRFLITAITVLALMVLTVPTYAIPTLRLTDMAEGGTTVEIQDGLPGDGNSLQPGVVSFNGAVGTTWIVNITAGLTKPVLGSSSLPIMDLSSFNLSTTTVGGGTLRIMFSENGFDALSAANGFTTAIGGTTLGSVTSKTYMDPNDGMFGGMFVPVNELGPFGPVAFSGSDSSGAFVPLTNPYYSLTQAVTIVHTGAGSSSFDNYTTTAVPEPGTLMLLGSGLLGMVFLRRKVKN